VKRRACLGGQGAASTRHIPLLGLQLFSSGIGAAMRIYRADGSVRSNLVVEARQEGRDIADQIRYWAGDLLISLVTTSISKAEYTTP
jgi:hypothetical protein